MEIFDFISKKKNDGITIVETIKAVMLEYQISLGESKVIVSNHPAWQSVVEATQPLHDEILKIK